MWISQENEDCQGKIDNQQPKKTGKKTPYNRVGLSFPKALRILSRAQFQKNLREGRRFTGKTVSLFYHEGISHSKLGITVSKKYGKAHDRNRFKRVVREAFREVYAQVPQKICINILPRLPKTKITKQDVLADLQALFWQIQCKTH